MVGGRLGGHMVQGHVDGVGSLVSSAHSGVGQVMEFSFPRELERYLVHKGSIAVDGISLTIASLDRQFFRVAVIPHTLRATNLQYLKTGDPVNLEVDLLAKYFERFFQLGLMESRPSRSAIDLLWEEGS
jgi:riboflavin synthase